MVKQYIIIIVCIILDVLFDIYIYISTERVEPNYYLVFILNEITNVGIKI